MISNKYLSKFGYVIRKEVLSEDVLKSLKHELVGRPLTDDKYGKNVQNTFRLYIETKNKIYIPKVYGIKRFGCPERLLPVYTGDYWTNEDIKFTGTLLPSQQEPVDKLLDNLKGITNGGILSLATGSGKSVCALYVLAQLKKKSIIIVNKIALLKQWEMEINRFLPNAKVGIIQGSNINVEGCDIVLAMLQSLAKIDYPPETFDKFGLTLCDEVHNTSSRIFSKVLMKLSSLYTIGLSATPKRSDGCEYVFKWFIGDIVYKTSGEVRGLEPIISVVTLKSKDYKTHFSTNQYTGHEQIQYSSMVSDLITMECRNNLIIDIIKEHVNVDRKILVLSDRREHLKTLKGLLDAQDIAFTYGLFLGQMKITELQRSKACRVILATYQAFGEGVSERDLDTLILATPKKYIGHLKNSTKNESGKLEQIVGRIFRKEHTLRHPVIIDLQDDFSIYSNQSRQRLTFYKQHFKNNLQIQKQIINLDKDEKFKIQSPQQEIQDNQQHQDQDQEHNLDFSKCLLD